MKKLIMGAVGALLVVAGALAAVIFGGFINVAADTPHSPAVHQLIEVARERGIERASREINAPANLADAERVRRGAGNYDAMCVDCHLSPGMQNSELRQGLYPVPPDLARAEQNGEASAGRQFWIIKHGIKASGMPAWSKGGMEDEVIWDMVAFLRHLPKLDQQQYRQLVAASDGHMHGGVVDEHPHHAENPARPAGNARKAKPAGDGHANHNHAH